MNGEVLRRDGYLRHEQLHEIEDSPLITNKKTQEATRLIACPDQTGSYAAETSFAAEETGAQTLPRQAAGRSILTLLGLTSAAKILVVGSRLDHWREVFPLSEQLQNLRDLQKTSRLFDLIIYHCDSAPNKEVLGDELGRLHGMISATGRLMFYAPNRYSPSLLIKNRSGVASRTRYRSLRAYRKLLWSTGFHDVREYLALPTLDAAEELVATKSRFLELPYHWHPFFHLARRFGVFPSVADGFVFIAGNQSLEQGRLFRTLDRLMSSERELPMSSYTLDRFDLRLRGALVLFVEEKLTARHVVVRVVSDPQIRGIVEQNQSFLAQLHGNYALPEKIKTLLPRLIGASPVDGSHIYIESLLEGVMAWKVNRRHLRKRIFADATAFIFQFQYVTRQKAQFDSLELNSFFHADQVRMRNCLDANPQLRKRVSDTLDALAKDFLGREVCLVASHGDYGYGNILVDAGSGVLKGVIDWDTGRMRDLPGIDLLNMEIQRMRMETGCDLSAAFQQVSGRALSSESLDPAGDYAQHLGVTPDLLPALLHLALIRYLTRASQYPEVFIEEQPQYLEVFNQLSVTAPL